MSDEDIAIAAIVLALALKRKKKGLKRSERQKRIWSKEYLKHNRHPWEGNIQAVLEHTNDNDFDSRIRMSKQTFDELLSKIAHRITKRNTIMRDCIPPKYRLSLTLLYLVNGATYESLKLQTGISPQTIGKIVTETCSAIIYELEDYIELPQTEHDWKKEASTFDERRDFPNCIGAIDGRHISILKPPNTAKQYFNYMKSFSFILMAVINANHEFMMVDISMSGSESSAETQFISKLNETTQDLPSPSKLPGSEEKLPYVFVSGNGLSLHDNIMTSFNQETNDPEKILFNQRIAKVHKLFENTFGILASRYKILLQQFFVSPEKAKVVVLACCYLHNFLLRKNEEAYLDGAFGAEDVETGEKTCADWQNEPQLPALCVGRFEDSTYSARSVRNRFCNYFSDSEALS